MTYLLDTNVVSEPRRRQPSSLVMSWFGSTPPATRFISVMTLGELRKGADRVAFRDPDQSAVLRGWLADTATMFRDRIIPVDAVIAEEWGRLQAARPVSPVDALLAATALVHGWTVVTRNERDFVPTGVPTINPFEAP
jgi:hypothetical protein